MCAMSELYTDQNFRTTARWEVFIERSDDDRELPSEVSKSATQEYPLRETEHLCCNASLLWEGKAKKNQTLQLMSVGSDKDEINGKPSMNAGQPLHSRLNSSMRLKPNGTMAQRNTKALRDRLIR